MGKTKAENNEYYKQYMKRLYDERMALARERLGGACVVCGSTENLEFDHIDRSTKKANVSTAQKWSEERFWLEVSKCQLLCKRHHLEKCFLDGSTKGPRTAHGKDSMYRHYGCRCMDCKRAHTEVSRKYRKQKLRG